MRFYVHIRIVFLFSLSIFVTFTQLEAVVPTRDIVHRETGMLNISVDSNDNDRELQLW